jgi:hypothetical protein
MRARRSSSSACSTTSPSPAVERASQRSRRGHLQSPIATRFLNIDASLAAGEDEEKT